MRTFHQLNEAGAYLPWKPAMRSLGSSGVELIAMDKPAGDYADPATDRLLVIQCQTENIRYTIDMEDGAFSGRAHLGDLVVVPPCATTRFQVRDDHAFRIAALPPALLNAASPEEPSALDERTAPLRRRCFRNVLVSEVMDRLWEIGDADGHVSAYGEAAALIIGAEIVKEAGQDVSVASGGLSPRNVACACDFMLANLDRQIATADVAAAVQLSPFHFTRQFRRSLGSSPQQWLTQQRIAVAKVLIRDEARLPMGEVASRVGYQSQSAFGAVFTKVTGMSPGRFRQSSR